MIAQVCVGRKRALVMSVGGRLSGCHRRPYAIGAKEPEAQLSSEKDHATRPSILVSLAHVAAWELPERLAFK